MPIEDQVAKMYRQALPYPEIQSDNDKDLWNFLMKFQGLSNRDARVMNEFIVLAMPIAALVNKMIVGDAEKRDFATSLKGQIEGMCSLACSLCSRIFYTLSDNDNNFYVAIKGGCVYVIFDGFTFNDHLKRGGAVKS